MSKVKTIVRYLLGIMLTVFGLNIFFGFLPMPPLAPAAMDLMQAFIKAGYIMPIVGFVEVLVGVLLLFNKYVPLALVLIFPIILNAFLFHLALDPAGIGGAIFALIMIIYLMIENKYAYRDLIKA